MFKELTVAAAVMAAVVAQAVPAAACGGLVAPNGAIRLTRASTLVDWRDGVEHYLTSFSYQGAGFDSFGYIVPLPAVPDKVEEGGGWTLQRLFRETHPQKLFLAAGAAAPAAQARDAEVLMQVQVRALDISVLRGSGASIVDWCAKNGFLLDKETRAHLENYAHGSPIFMAAKYNVARAQASNQLVGDGAPVLITMHTPHLWVPLEVLANGVQQVSADLYLLTRDPVYLGDLAAIAGESPVGGFVPRAPGFAVNYQQPVSTSLFKDLSTDKNMGWVRPDSWLTYLTLDAPAQTVNYDMGISDTGVIHLAAYGTRPDRVGCGVADIGGGSLPGQFDNASAGLLPAGVATLLLKSLAVLLTAAAAIAFTRRRLRAGS